MFTYTLEARSKLDMKLSAEFHKNVVTSDWVDFIRKLPGVVDAQIYENKYEKFMDCGTILTFANESDLSMFLLRWG